MLPAMTAEAQSGTAVRSHRVLTRRCVTVATILAFFACFAVWANRQALNTDNWTETSSNLLANHAVQNALSVYLVNQVFTSMNVSHSSKKRSPGQLKGALRTRGGRAAPACGQAVPKLLATAQVQELWRQANRNAHRQLLAILNGGNTLDLDEERRGCAEPARTRHPARGPARASRSQVERPGKNCRHVRGEVARATAEQKLGITLPPDDRQHHDPAREPAQNRAGHRESVKGLAILLPLLGIALYALAIWLAEGRRRRMLRTVGWCFFGVGLVLLLARRSRATKSSTNLVKVQANKPAGEAVWAIGTGLLHDIASRWSSTGSLS